jgi:hypothetical protein
MSHLLSSVNPEAAERIENPAMDAPDIATMVVYRARRGIMRMGRTEFPAIVLGHDEEGWLELLVMMEPEDMMLESHVRPLVEGNTDQGHCWRHVEDDRTIEIEDLKVSVDTLAESLEVARREIDDLKKLILGDYKPAKLSVYDLLAEFEGKLKAKKGK